MKLQDFLNAVENKIKTFTNKNFKIYDTNLPTNDAFFGEFIIQSFYEANNNFYVQASLNIYVKHSIIKKYIDLYYLSLTILRVLKMYGARLQAMDLNPLDIESKKDYVISINFSLLCNEDFNTLGIFYEQ
jgi:hypothetical protein